MADLGDIGMYKATSGIPWNVTLFSFEDSIKSFSDAALGGYIPATGQRLFAGPSTRSKPATPFVVLIEDAVPGELYLLSREGLPTDVPRRAAPTGELRFFDLDNGTYVVHSSQGSSAFRIVVTGTSYTVETLYSGGGGTVADNFYGGVA